MSKTYDDYQEQDLNLPSKNREQDIQHAENEASSSVLQRYGFIIPWIFLFAIAAAELAVGYWSISVGMALHVTLLIAILIMAIISRYRWELKRSAGSSAEVGMPAQLEPDLKDQASVGGKTAFYGYRFYIGLSLAPLIRILSLSIPLKGVAPQYFYLIPGIPLLAAIFMAAKMAGFEIVNEPEKVRASIGILFGGESGLYDRLTAEENIAYFGELNDMDRTRIKERIKELARIFNMEEYLTRRAGKLSKGMRQKVAFARAIIHDPDIMLFDEPTSGLDVSAIRDVHEFIKSCKAEGKTVIFSSHSMDEVDKLCDRVGVIHKGKLVADGTLDGIKSEYGDQDLENIFIRLVGGKSEA